MKHIRNLWNLLKQEISLWKYEKQELVKGICYIVMIAWLFFDRIAFAILLICNVGLCALHIFVDLAELADHVLNLVDKAGPVAGEF